MMRIKEPVLFGKQKSAIYIVDVEGKKIEATYYYDLNNEFGSGWEYDLTPCYVGLTDEEIEDLEDEFSNVILNIEV
jgi:hypothetical protein